MLSHYSKEVGKVFSLNYPTPPDNEHSPGGLWLSDDSDYGWYSFVMERWRNGDHGWGDGKEILQYKYDFEIDPLQFHHVLKLSTPDALQEFTSYYQESAPRDCVVDGSIGFGLHIDWGRVKTDYMGILITPFQRELNRLGPKFHWYRFDCASGCFWNIACLVQDTKS